MTQRAYRCTGTRASSKPSYFAESRWRNVSILASTAVSVVLRFSSFRRSSQTACEKRLELAFSFFLFFCDKVVFFPVFKDKWRVIGSGKDLLM